MNVLLQSCDYNAKKEWHKSQQSHCHEGSEINPEAWRKNIGPDIQEADVVIGWGMQQDRIFKLMPEKSQMVLMDCVIII